MAVIYRASWPDQKVIRGTLGDIRPKVRAAKITRTALIIVGKVLSDEEFKKKTDAEKLEFIKKQLEEAGSENIDENANEIVGKKLRFHFTDVDNLPKQMLFDIELKAGIYNIKLNKQHPAFLDFFKLLADQDSLEEGQPSSERGLKLLLESWARLEDEAPENLKDQLQEIRLQWGTLALAFFKKKN